MTETDDGLPTTIEAALHGAHVGWVNEWDGHGLVAVEVWNRGRAVFAFTARGGRWTVEETATRMRGSAYLTAADWSKLRKLAEAQLGTPRTRQWREEDFANVGESVFPGLTPGVFGAVVREFSDVRQGGETPLIALALLAAAYVEATALGRGKPTELLRELAACSGHDVPAWPRRMTAAGKRGLWDRERAALTPLGARLVADYWGALGRADAEHDEDVAADELNPCYVALDSGAPAHVAQV